MPVPALPSIDLGRILPPRARQITYAVFVVALVVRFALDLAFEVDPEWLLAVGRTLDGLSPLALGLALINVPTGDIVDGSSAIVLGSSNAQRHPDDIG